MNVFVCFNLLLVCTRNLATEKWKKNILRKGSSTEDIGIITLARDPLGTAEADIVTLLHDFFDNSQTAEVRFTSKVLRETFFHCAYFEILATPLWRHWQTQTGEKLKSRVNYSSGYVQKPVEKSTNTLEKFIQHRKCCPGPKACENIYTRIVKIFWKVQKQICWFLGEFWSFFTCQISYLRYQRQKNLKVAVHFHIYVLQHP